LEYVYLLILILDVDGVRYNLCVVLPLLQTLCGLVVMVISQYLIGVSIQTTLKYFTVRDDIVFVLFCLYFVFVIAIW